MKSHAYATYSCHECGAHFKQRFFPKRGQEIGDNVDPHLACPICESINTEVIKVKKIRKDE